MLRGENAARTKWEAVWKGSSYGQTGGSLIFCASRTYWKKETLLQIHITLFAFLFILHASTLFVVFDGGGDLFVFLSAPISIIIGRLYDNYGEYRLFF